MVDDVDASKKHSKPYILTVNGSSSPMAKNKTFHRNSIFLSGWWFQPIWKICLSNYIISPSRGENKKYLKPPPSYIDFLVEKGQYKYMAKWSPWVSLQPTISVVQSPRKSPGSTGLGGPWVQIGKVSPTNPRNIYGPYVKFHSLFNVKIALKKTTF